MALGAPRNYAALNSFIHVISIYQCRTRQFEVCHIYRGFITHTYVAILTYILFKKREHILNLIFDYFSKRCRDIQVLLKLDSTRITGTSYEELQ